MRLGFRIAFYVIVTCIVPMLVLAVYTRSLVQDELEAVVASGQSGRAAASARSVAHQLADVQRTLQVQMASFRLETSPDEARSYFLVATFRLVPQLAQLALVDRDGQLLLPPLSSTPGAEDRPAASSEFLSQLPMPAGADPVFGPPLKHPDGTVSLPLVLPSPYDGGYLLAAEISLADIALQMQQEGGDERELGLLDRQGNLLVHAGLPGLIDISSVRSLLGSDAVALQYEGNQGTVVAATAAVGDSFLVVVAEPANAVTNATDRLYAQSRYILLVALVAAGVMGWLLTRSLTVPVLRLRNAAAMVGKGNFEVQVPVEDQDELGQLANSFNDMTRSLARSSAELAEKNKQIEEFNQVLQARVEQRTAELQSAQARLVQTEQLAAVAELASGVAHELNNPLAGILGILQIVIQTRDGQPEVGLLQAAEEQALRCRDILATLGRFTRSGGLQQRTVIHLSALFQDVLALVSNSFQQRGVSVTLVGLSGLSIHGDGGMLYRAIGQIFASLRSITVRTGALTVEGRRDGSVVEIRFSVSDSATSVDDWQAAGLGFWAARQVLQEHGATFSEPVGSYGGPRSWILRFPEQADAS